MNATLHERLRDALGAENVLTAPEDLSVYSFDAYSEGKLPSAVVIPSDTRQVSAVVKIARAEERPELDLVHALPPGV